MSKQDILGYIQSQYPNQIVLYSDQLATILGKSQKALAHLIARGKLPFDPKRIGGKYCVDIFQIAEFLSSPCKPIVEPDFGKDTGEVIGRKRQSRKSSRVSLGPKLAQMRVESVFSMRCTKKNGWPKGFINEFALELLLISAVVQKGERWSVCIDSEDVGPTEDKLVYRISRKKFQSTTDAVEYMLSFIRAKKNWGCEIQAIPEDNANTFFALRDFGVWKLRGGTHALLDEIDFILSQML